MRAVIALAVVGLCRGGLHDAVNDQGHEEYGESREFILSWNVAPEAEAANFCKTLDVRGCGALLVEEVHKQLISTDALSTYLVCRGHNSVEGHTSMFPVSEQVLRSLVSDASTIRRAMQIGFNAGHSAMTILSVNPSVHLTSYDVVEHPYALKAAAYLDTVFPGRHKLVPGDSSETIPAAFELSVTLFDFIFIDGGHTYDVAAADLRNCMRMARAGTLVVMDDVVGTPASWWTKGPTQAWDEAVRSGIVVELGRMESSRGSAKASWVQTSRCASSTGATTAGMDGLAFGFYTGSAKHLVDTLLQHTAEVQ